MNTILSKVRSGLSFCHHTVAVQPFSPTALNEELLSLPPIFNAVVCVGNAVWSVLSNNKDFFDRFEPSQKHEEVLEGFVGTYWTVPIHTDAYSMPESIKFLPPDHIIIAVFNNQHVQDIIKMYVATGTVPNVPVEVQTRPKPAGTAVNAVQFLGDPTVHPSIYWCPPEDIGRGLINRGHWRLGGESHGGGYDSGSMFLAVGDWIVGQGREMRIIHTYEFNRDWQLVEKGTT